MSAPVNQLNPMQSALIVDEALRSAPYSGQDPVIDDRDGHVDALAAVAAVLAHRGLSWCGFRTSWSIHGLSHLRFHDEHVPKRNTDAPAAYTAVLSLDVPHSQKGAALKSVVSSAAHSLRDLFDDEGLNFTDVIVVVTHREQV